MIDLDPEVAAQIAMLCVLLAGMFFLSALLDEDETPKKPK